MYVIQQVFFVVKSIPTFKR